MPTCGVQPTRIVDEAQLSRLYNQWHDDSRLNRAFARTHLLERNKATSAEGGNSPRDKLTELLLYSFGHFLPQENDGIKMVARPKLLSRPVTGTYKHLHHSSPMSEWSYDAGGRSVTHPSKTETPSTARFFSFFNLTYSRWTSSLPSCLWSQRIFPSLPGSRLTFFYRDASSAPLQLVNQWLNFTYSRSHAFRYERNNTNPTLVRIELTISALGGCAGYLLDHSGDALLARNRPHLSPEYPTVRYTQGPPTQGLWSPMAQPRGRTKGETPRSPTPLRAKAVPG